MYHAVPICRRIARNCSTSPFLKFSRPVTATLVHLLLHDSSGPESSTNELYLHHSNPSYYLIPNAAMMLQLIFALAAAIPFAAAFPTFELPRADLRTYPRDDDCILPEEFVVQDFRLWISKADKQTAIVDFKYSDSGTGIDTYCHFDSSSANVGPPGSAPRFACNNPDVQFIMESSSLTMIEKACPGSNPWVI